MHKKTTDDQSELFTQVDADDNVIGPVARRVANIDKNFIHRAVGVLIVNDQDEMLMQKRTMTKDTSPGMWACAVGGHVTYGDTYDEAAHREVHEEIGLTCDLEFLVKILVEDGIEAEYTNIYLGKVIGQPVFKLHPEEVAAIEWVPIKKLAHFISTHEIAYPTLQYLKATGYIV